MTVKLERFSPKLTAAQSLVLIFLGFALAFARASAACCARSTMQRA